MLEPSAYEVEMTIEKLKSKKSPCFDQIPVELIKAGVVQFAIRSRNLIFLFGIRENYLRSGRSRSFYLSIRRAIKEGRITFAIYVQNFIQCPAVKVNSICRGNY